MARVNLPPLTRTLLLALIAFTLLNAIVKPEYTALGPFTRTGNGTPYIAIVPRTSWKYPWTFATATFVEQNVFGLIVTGLTLFYGGRYLERAWSSNEFAKFILFVGVIPNILCFALYVVLFALSKSDKALYAFLPTSYSSRQLTNHFSPEAPPFLAALPFKQASSLHLNSLSRSTPSPSSKA